MDSLFEARLEKVRGEMAMKSFSGLVVSDPESIFYLTGISVNPYERLFALCVSPSGTPKLVANALFNLGSIGSVDLEIKRYNDGDDAVKILADAVPHSGVVGVDKILQAKFLIPLMLGTKGARFSVGSECVDSARAIKDSAEQLLMKEASRINDICIQRAFDFVSEGKTEREVADFIRRCFIEEGADGECFETNVSFGANSADPHHESDGTALKAGDCILIDMGCRKNGYCADMTRTAFFKSADDEMRKIHDIVRSANEKAESIIAPGIRLCDIDKAAREVISQAGYGEHFTHRTGHFIGLGAHEEGDVSAVSKETAKEGMIFSIEPGIYLPGRFGVRIEDLVLVTSSGCQRLNLVDKNYQILGLE